MKENRYRNELKYVCSEAELAQIKNRIEHLLQRDYHVGEKDTYVIRSVYFDTYHNQYYYENENGYDKREKFRIRVYNADFSNIKLELKGKENGLAWKDVCKISEEQCRKMLDGDELEISKSNPDLLNRFILKMKTTGLRPVIIVEYDRLPYVYRTGNVRVTFDYNVRSGNRIEEFWKKNLLTRPVLSNGKHVLEVKYDAIFPDYIKNMIEVSDLQRTAFSKYYMCRKFTIGGNENDIFRRF